MGRLKKRIKASDIIINLSKGTKAPEPPPGQKWKEIRHDPQVTWLACWIENVQGMCILYALNFLSRFLRVKFYGGNSCEAFMKIRAPFDYDLQVIVWFYLKNSSTRISCVKLKKKKFQKDLFMN